MLRCLCWLSLVAGLAAFGLAGYSFLDTRPAEQAPPPAVSAEFAGPELADLEPGREYRAGVRVANPADQPLRVVGIDETCGLHCCFGITGELPVSVPPRSRVTVPILVRARSPGPFQDKIRLFIDAGSLKELECPVQGNVRNDGPARP